jgi:hypothetical protein
MADQRVRIYCAYDYLVSEVTMVWDTKGSASVAFLPQSIPGGQCGGHEYAVPACQRGQPDPRWLRSSGKRLENSIPQVRRDWAILGKLVLTGFELVGLFGFQVC